MSYLFPILKCGKIYAIWNKLNSEQCHSDYRYYLGFAEDAYKIATSRYPGFGFLLSFFPGTSAYKARIALSTRLKSKRQELLDNIKKVLDIAETRDGEKRIFILEKQMWKSSLAGLFNMSYCWEKLEEVRFFFNNLVLKNGKFPLKDCFLLLPFISDVLEKPEEKIQRDEHYLENIIRSCLNPFRIVKDLVNFSSLLLFRMFDIGSKRFEPSSKLRLMLKGLIFAIAWPARIVLDLGEKLFNIPYEILKFSLYTFPKGLVRNLSSLYKTRHQRLVITTVENARHVNALKEAVKSSYSEIGDKLSQAATYLNTQETDKLDKEDIVVIRVKKEEAIEYTRLFRIYKKHGQINEQAQKEAKNVMGVLPN